MRTPLRGQQLRRPEHRPVVLVQLLPDALHLGRDRAAVFFGQVLRLPEVVGPARLVPASRIEPAVRVVPVCCGDPAEPAHGTQHQGGPAAADAYRYAVP